MERLKRLYWRIYYRVFGIVADQVRPDAQTPAGRISRKDWREMVLHEAQRDADGVGRLDAYACLVCKRIFVTVQRTPGMTFYRTPCLNCPKVRQVGKMSFPNPIAFATSYYHSGQTRALFKLTPEMATYEFFRPSYEAYLRDEDSGRRNYLETGGLLLRRIATFANVD